MSITPVIIDGLPTLTIGPPGSGALGTANSIDAVNDYLSIYQNSSTSTLGINRNTLLNLSSAPVGLTDSQTLTNKTITSPTISGPTLSGTIIGTYTIGGSPTFPSSVVTLTGSQTLTNKILTSPTINAPTITNASITADAIVGFTTTNAGTVYGIAVTAGTISSAGIASGAVTNAKIGANAVFSGNLGLSSSYTSGVQTFASNGTFYYVNLGGIKILWGLATANTLSGSAPQQSQQTVTIPSFFSSIQSITTSVVAPGATGYMYSNVNSYTTTSLVLSLTSTNGSGGSGSIGVFVVGT